MISASCNSKATLRAAADEFVSRHERAIYFPAFEMATIFQPMRGQSIFAEGRENFHVSSDTVEFIMKEFFEAFCR